MTDLLTGQLAASETLAEGDAGGLLSLTSSHLSSSESSELTYLIPGVSIHSDSSGIASMVSNMDALNSAFESLGLNPCLVSQFAPLIIEYLTLSSASSGCPFL